MKTNHIFAILAILPGEFAAFTSYSDKKNRYPTWEFEKARMKGEKVRFVSPHHLAELLYQKQEVTLLDARSWQDYEEYHVPTSLHLHKDQMMDYSTDLGTIVLYGASGDEDIYDLASALSGRVYVLKGGIKAWYSLVLFPDMVKYRIRNADQLRHLVRRCEFFGGEAQNTQLLNLNVRENRYREGC